MKKEGDIKRRLRKKFKNSIDNLQSCKFFSCFNRECVFVFKNLILLQCF